jgi:hypothetical protein
MEFAEVLQKHRDELVRDIRICFWQGHENGIMEGSTWFVDNFWDDLDSGCVAHFSIDSSGMIGTSVWRCERSWEEYDWVASLNKDILPPDKATEYSRVIRYGDMSFFGVGIPSNSAWMIHTKEEIARMHNATLGEYYHGEGDDFSRIDGSIMRECMTGTVSHVSEMLTRRVLPMNFVSNADVILERIEALQELMRGNATAERGLELGKARAVALDFRKKAAALDALRKKTEADERADARKLNFVLRKLSRELLPMLNTITGRYDQDSYGRTDLNYVIPAASGSIARMLEHEEGSHGFNLWMTQARRDRNKITDALRHASDWCEMVLDL